jgi:hypothetical protein
MVPAQDGERSIAREGHSTVSPFMPLLKRKSPVVIFLVIILFIFFLLVGGAFFYLRFRDEKSTFYYRVSDAFNAIGLNSLKDKIFTNDLFFPEIWQLQKVFWDPDESNSLVGLVNDLQVNNSQKLPSVLISKLGTYRGVKIIKNDKDPNETYFSLSFEIDNNETIEVKYSPIKNRLFWTRKSLESGRFENHHCESVKVNENDYQRLPICKVDQPGSYLEKGDKLLVVWRIDQKSLGGIKDSGFGQSEWDKISTNFPLIIIAKAD